MACGDSFSPEGISGTYNLETINGTDLPASSMDGSVYTAGSITLTAEGTFTVSATWDGEEETSVGTFTLVEPSTIRLAFPGEDTLSGTLDGDRLTLIGDDGDTFVFRK